MLICFFSLQNSMAGLLLICFFSLYFFFLQNSMAGLLHRHPETLDWAARAQHWQRQIQQQTLLPPPCMHVANQPHGRSIELPWIRR